jgi:hypothetical protein
VGAFAFRNRGDRAKARSRLADFPENDASHSDGLGRLGRGCPSNFAPLAIPFDDCKPGLAYDHLPGQSEQSVAINDSRARERDQTIADFDPRACRGPFGGKADDLEGAIRNALDDVHTEIGSAGEGIRVQDFPHTPRKHRISLASRKTIFSPRPRAGSDHVFFRGGRECDTSFFSA